jgi:hypothetical protein
MKGNFQENSEEVLKHLEKEKNVRAFEESSGIWMGI